MIQIPVKTKERLITGIKKFSPIITKAHDKDINESDTTAIVIDILAEVFGYNKFDEITSEYAVKKTYCDLALKIDSTPIILIEVKAIGLELKSDFIRQAVDYGSNSGVEWIVLTNARNWKIYKILFGKPIEKELVYEFDFLQINSKKQNDLEALYYLCKEATTKNKPSLDDYFTQKQLLSRFLIGQILMSETVLDCVRKTVKKISSEARIQNDEILNVISEEIIKREVLEGEKASEAKKRLAKMNKQAKTPAAKTSPSSELKM